MLRVAGFACLFAATLPAVALKARPAVAASTVTLSASSYAIVQGSDGTLTATVSSSGVAPAGTVSFYYGTQLLATAPVSNGAASFTGSTAGLAEGIYTLGAKYSGDSTHASATAAPLTFTVEAVKDCSSNACAAISIPSDPPSSGGFHGYADPSMRKDPNSGLIYMSYSWPQPDIANDSQAVDLHLAHSADSGSTWTKDGDLFSTAQVDNSTSSNYAAVNATSFEVSDLLPASLNGVTYWAQAHRAYLVGEGDSIYAQTPATSVIALSVYELPDAQADPAALVNIAGQKQTILGTSTTDPTIGANVNLSALSPAVSACVDFDQPALYFDGSALYLAVECETASGSGVTGEDLDFAVFSTVPGSLNPTQWTWKYNGTFATRAQAVALGKREGAAYQFLTELEFVKSRSGQLLALVNPSVLNPSGEQPVIQYGCRAVPVLSLNPPTLLVDPNGAPEPVASVTESDLYVSPNEGPGACTYEPAANNGIVLVKKLENDPVEGFYVTLESSGVTP